MIPAMLHIYSPRLSFIFMDDNQLIQNFITGQRFPINLCVSRPYSHTLHRPAGINSLHQNGRQLTATLAIITVLNVATILMTYY
jgi:hypothetical protein